ncbi:MAG: peptide ABC transporter substrate-binding protein [Campylobacteraceae bacterium]|nr:peptide ABC transporter substrate-binding protein [Campylobacteraceae bacterium]
MKLFKILKAALFTCLLITSANAAQELVRGNGSEPATLDPTLGEGTPGSNITRDLFEGLMTVDGEGNVIPGQAESYTISDDKKTYVFKIRKNAKWSNGDDVTANDFEYAFKRGIDPVTAARYSWYFKILGIKNGADILDGKKPASSLGVKSLDSKTLEITLGTPIPYFIIGLSHISTSPVPKKLIEKYGKDWTKPANIASNGPYKLSKWVVNEKIVAVKNNLYYGAKDVKIEKVTFLPIPNQSTELNRYKAGEIDILYELPKNKYKNLMKTMPNEVRVLGRVGTYYYYLNMKKKPFDNVKVRKALSYAVNRDILTQKVLGTGEKPAYTFVPDNVSGFTPLVPEYAKWTQKERNKKALKLLNEAGFTKSNPLKFEILYNTSEQHKRNALAISSMWKKAFKGAVKVTLINQEWKTFLDEKKAGNYQVARAGWIGDYNEASTMLDLLTKGHSSNNSFYDNPEYDKLMNIARSTSDDVKRNKLYQKIDLIVAEDMPIIPLFQYSNARLVKPYVGGYPKSNPLDTILTKYLYIKK